MDGENLVNRIIKISDYVTWELAKYCTLSPIAKMHWEFVYKHQVNNLSQDELYTKFQSYADEFMVQFRGMPGFGLPDAGFRPGEINYLEFFNYINSYFSCKDEYEKAKVKLEFIGTIPEKPVIHISEKDKKLGAVVFFTLDSIKFLIMFIFAILAILAMISTLR